MKLGLKGLVIALVVALAAVPAAFAGNGHGGGKPSWAGNGTPSWAGGGKPSWAASGPTSTNAHHGKKPKKDKDEAKHDEADSSADAGTQSDDVDLEGLNPAWYCKTIRDEMTQLERDFATMFGTNPNNANAFGKCVSRRAHGEDLSDAVGGDDAQEDSCVADEQPEGTSDDEESTELGSDDEAAGQEECESDDSATDEPAVDEQGQGEGDQGGGDGGTVDGGDSSDLATVLRFLRL
jgi:hypothetical protein